MLRAAVASRLTANLSWSSQAGQLLKCFFLCFRVFATVFQDLFLQPAPQCGLQLPFHHINTLGAIPAPCPLQVRVPCFYPMILQTPGPSSSILQLGFTSSPWLQSQCFALPSKSTQRSRSGRSAPFCPSPHLDLLCALHQDTRTHSSQTATTDWSLHPGRAAQGLGGLLARSNCSSPVCPEQQRTGELGKHLRCSGSRNQSQLKLNIPVACIDPAAQARFTPSSLGTGPFGLSGSQGQKTIDLSIA